MGRHPKKALIYIVDDQSTLLDLAEVSLQDSRYRVKKFQDPTCALDSFRKAKIKPDLLITDYAMGKLNGLDLIQRCKAISPSLRTILLSGTMGAEILFESPVQVDRFLGKPYQPSGLAELVQRILKPK